MNPSNALTKLAAKLDANRAHELRMAGFSDEISTLTDYSALLNFTVGIPDDLTKADLGAEDLDLYDKAIACAVEGSYYGKGGAMEAVYGFAKIPPNRLTSTGVQLAIRDVEQGSADYSKFFN